MGVAGHLVASQQPDIRVPVHVGRYLGASHVERPEPNGLRHACHQRAEPAGHHQQFWVFEEFLEPGSYSISHLAPLSAPLLRCGTREVWRRVSQRAHKANAEQNV